MCVELVVIVEVDDVVCVDCLVDCVDFCVKCFVDVE